MNNLAGQILKAFTVVAVLVISAVGVASDSINDRDGKLLDVGPPTYPKYCFDKRLQGYVDFIYGVDTDGLVKNATVVDAVVYRKSPDKPVDDERARQAFISFAKAALRNFRYEPPIKNGQVVETDGVKNRINFKLGN